MPFPYVDDPDELRPSTPEEAGLLSALPPEPEPQPEDQPETVTLTPTPESAPQAPLAEPGPSAHPAPQGFLAPRPGGSDAVRKYLESKLHGAQIDPKLQQAQQQEQWARLVDGLGHGMAGIGDAHSRNAAAFANAIAGQGFHVAPTQDHEAPRRNFAEDGPVAQYLAAKRSAQADAQTELTQAKTAMDIKKLEDGSDPDSLQARKLALMERAENRHLDQGGRGLDLKEKDGERSDNRLEEAKRFHDFQEKMGWANLDERQRGRALQWYKANQNDQRIGLAKEGLGIRQEKMNNEEGQGLVPLAESQDRYQKPAVANDLNDRAQSAQSVLGTLSKLQKLEEDHRLGVIAPTEAAAQMQTLFAELGPQWNAAQTKLAFSGPRGAAIGHALTDPASAKGIIKDLLSGGTYSKANLKTARDLVLESLQHQGEARGVHFGSDFGEHSKSRTPKVGTAAPSRPGSGSGPGESPANVSEEMVDMVSPDGNRVRVKKSRVNAALKAGGKLANGG